MAQDFSDWWERWWKKDFSWEGLAEKRLWGLVRLPDGSVVEKAEDAKGDPVTLQDYWGDQEGHLIESPVSGRKYTCIHLPLTWEDGTPTGKAEWAAGSEDFEAYRAALRSRLNAPVCAMLQGAFLLGFGIKDLIVAPRFSEERIVIRIPINLERAFFLDPLGSIMPLSPDTLRSITPPSPDLLGSTTLPSPETLRSITPTFPDTLGLRAPNFLEALGSRTLSFPKALGSITLPFSRGLGSVTPPFPEMLDSITLPSPNTLCLWVPFLSGLFGLAVTGQSCRHRKLARGFFWKSTIRRIHPVLKAD